MAISDHYQLVNSLVAQCSFIIAMFINVVNGEETCCADPGCSEKVKACPEVLGNIYDAGGNDNGFSTQEYSLAEDVNNGGALGSEYFPTV